MSPEQRKAIRGSRPSEEETEVEDQEAETMEIGEEGREQGRRLLKFAGTGTGGFRGGLIQEHPTRVGTSRAKKDGKQGLNRDSSEPEKGRK
jgi:hypothetical protein